MAANIIPRQYGGIAQMGENIGSAISGAYTGYKTGVEDYRRRKMEDVKLGITLNELNEAEKSKKKFNELKDIYKSHIKNAYGNRGYDWTSRAITTLDNMKSPMELGAFNENLGIVDEVQAEAKEKGISYPLADPSIFIVDGVGKRIQADFNEMKNKALEKEVKGEIEKGRTAGKSYTDIGAGLPPEQFKAGKEQLTFGQTGEIAGQKEKRLSAKEERIAKAAKLDPKEKVKEIKQLNDRIDNIDAKMASMKASVKYDSDAKNSYIALARQKQKNHTILWYMDNKDLPYNDALFATNEDFKDGTQTYVNEEDLPELQTTKPETTSQISAQPETTAQIKQPVVQPKATIQQPTQAPKLTPEQVAKAKQALNDPSVPEDKKQKIRILLQQQGEM